MAPLKEITRDLVRDIKSEYPDLKAVNLANNEIERIENLEPLTGLTKLDLSHNRIKRLIGIQNQVPYLEILLLSDNLVDDFQELDALAYLPQLHTLTLHGNPITIVPDYRAEVLRRLPQITVLDGVTVSPAERQKSKPQPEVDRYQQLAEENALLRSKIQMQDTRLRSYENILHSQDHVDRDTSQRKVELLTDENLALQTKLQLQEARLRSYENMLNSHEEGDVDDEHYDADDVQLKRKLQLLTDENAALQNKIQLQDVRLRSYDDIIAIQDEQMHRLRNDETYSNDEITSKWRQKVYELLVQQRSIKLANETAYNQSQETIARLQKELHSSLADVEMLTTREIGLKAQIEIEATATRLARAALSKVEANEQRLKSQVVKQSVLLKTVQEMGKMLNTMRIDFEEKVKTSMSHLNIYTQRVGFAQTRIKLVKDLLDAQRHGKPVPPQFTLIPPGTQSSSHHRVFKDPTLAGLSQEIERLTTERDLFAKKYHQIATGAEDKLKQHNDEMEKKLEAKSAELTSLQETVQQKTNQCAALELRVEQLNRQLSLSHGDQEKVHKTIADLQYELQSQATRFKQDLEVALKREQAALAEEKAQLMEELNDLRTEASKAHLSMRSMERETQKLKEKNEAVEQAKFQYLEEQLSIKENQVRSLRRERNELLASIRQTERDLAQKIKLPPRTPLSSTTNDNSPRRISSPPQQTAESYDSRETQQPQQRQQSRIASYVREESQSLREPRKDYTGAGREETYQPTAASQQRRPLRDTSEQEDYRPSEGYAGRREEERGAVPTLLGDRGRVGEREGVEERKRTVGAQMRTLATLSSRLLQDDSEDE